VTPLDATPPRPTDGRLGRVFSVRLRASDEEILRGLMFQESQQPWIMGGGWNPYTDGATRSLGAFVIWAAKQWRPPTRSTPAPAGKTRRRVRPERPRRRPRPAGRVRPKKSKKGKR